MGKEVQAYSPPMCQPVSLVGVVRERTAGIRPLELSSLTSSMAADSKAGKTGPGDDLTGSDGINLTCA